MEIEFFNNVVYEEDTIEINNITPLDNLGAEGERCGICMDVVIDRGVLDCCQHWFCFVCIDNWATITNLCPLCQKEFQLITCISVFDTVGGGKDDEDLNFRDDWCAEEKNSVLSFPSYYIDENAVTCLNGDGCKLRNGSIPYEETLTLDTCIACDSCDIWYHAYCVGFNPEGSCVDSWLCPRCLAIEADQKSDLKEMHSTGTNAYPHHLVGTSSGKVSICVADTRERALVVSRIHSEDVSEPIVDCHYNKKNSDNHHEVEQSLVGIKCLSKMKTSLNQGMNLHPEPMVPLTKAEIIIKSEPVDNESRMSLDVGQSFASNLSDGKANNSSSRNGFLHRASLDENMENLKVDIGPRLGEKRKRQGSSLHTDVEIEHASSSSMKKLKVQWGSRSTYLDDPANVSAPEDFHESSKLVERYTDEMNGNISTKKKKPFDVMRIVPGTEVKAAYKPVRQKEAGKSAKVEKSASVLRVKKILQRPSEDKDSDVVQKPKKETRALFRISHQMTLGETALTLICWLLSELQWQDLQLNQLKKYLYQWSKLSQCCKKEKQGRISQRRYMQHLVEIEDGHSILSVKLNFGSISA